LLKKLLKCNWIDTWYWKESSKSKNINQSNADLTLELFAIDIFKKKENFEIVLLFSKNGIITLSTEVIDVTLEDQKIENDKSN